jgi:hypothetical protein
VIDDQPLDVGSIRLEELCEEAQDALKKSGELLGLCKQKSPEHDFLSYACGELEEVILSAWKHNSFRAASAARNLFEAHLMVEYFFPLEPNKCAEMSSGVAKELLEIFDVTTKHDSKHGLDLSTDQAADRADPASPRRALPSRKDTQIPRLRV